MLITLGIIGVVAALTIPTISSNIQQVVLKSQFKKFYSTFMQAIISVQTKEGRPIKCFYWDERPQNFCTATCTEKNEFNSCIAWACAETGSPLPSDINGPMNECSMLQRELFLNTLKTAKICKNQAYDNGCLPKDIHGVDIFKKEENPDRDFDPNLSFSDSNIKNNNPVFVLADGSYIIGYYRYLSGNPFFAVDINGHKGPNKWGYDIYDFAIYGTQEKGITKLKPLNYIVESGGKDFTSMYKNVFGQTK